MGWLFMPRGSMGGHATAKAYLDNQFTYERVQDDGSSEGLKVLASSCPGNRVYYAATQVMTNGRGGEIFAIVCLVRWNPRAKDGYIFGYKDMDESMGPCETDCPASILDLLTPTDKVPGKYKGEEGEEESDLPAATESQDGAAKESNSGRNHTQLLLLHGLILSPPPPHQRVAIAF